MIKLTETKDGTILYIRVSPGRKAFELRGFDSWSNSLLLSTSEPAEKGKANKEIEKELERLFGKKTEIIKGKRARDKAVLLHCRSEEALRALERLIG